MPLSILSFKESEKLTSDFPLFSNDSFKRYGAIGDGNCMFHAFLFLVDEEYRSLTSEQDKQQYASKVRKAFAKKVKSLLQNPPKKSSDRILRQKLEDFKNFFDDTNTAESFIKKLAQPKEWCGEHVWNLLEMMHTTHIFMLLDDHTTNKTSIYCRGLDRTNIVYDKAVFILNIDGKHYEPIASIDKGRLKTIFNITDAVSQKHLSAIDDLCKTAAVDADDTESPAFMPPKDVSTTIGSKVPEVVPPPPPYEDADANSPEGDEYDEEILGNANVVFVEDEDETLSDIVLVRQKDINFVQYTKDQFTNTFHDLKLKADKKAVDTFYHLYKSSYGDTGAGNVASSARASMVYPVVHASLRRDDEDNSELASYFAQRGLIQKQKDDYRIRQQKLYDVHLPFINDRSEGADVTATVDEDVVIASDIQPLTFLRVMGKIPIYLPKDVDYIYKGDQITVYGYATKTAHRVMYEKGRYRKFNISQYQSNVATLKVNDVVDIYFNDFFYDDKEEAPLTQTTGVIYERDAKFIKIKVSSSIRQGHEATLKNIIYYQVEKYNPFYIYSKGTSTDSVFYKPLIAAADPVEWMFTPLLDSSLEKTLTFILPTLSELVFMYRNDTQSGFYHNLMDVHSLLRHHGYSFERLLPSEFQKIKHVIEHNTSKQVAEHKHDRKAIPVDTRPPYIGDTKFSTQSSFKTRKMAEALYPDLRLSSNKSHQDYIFQLFKQKDRGYLFIIKLYQQLLDTQLQNYSETDLTTRLQAAETLATSLRRDVATLKNPFLVKSTNLDIAVFYDDIQKLELDQHKVRGEWNNRYAVLEHRHATTLYKRLDNRWVRLCDMNERQEFDLLPLFSVHLSLLFDELTPEKLGDGLPLLQSVSQLANTEHVGKTLEGILASLPVANVHAHIEYLEALVASVYVQDYIPSEKEHKLRTDVGQGELDEDLEELMSNLDMNEAAAYSELRQDQLQVKAPTTAADSLGKQNEEKRILITTIAGRLGLTLTATELALIYNSLPLFEKMVLEEKLVALKAKEGAKLKGLSHVELMKKLFKSPSEKKEFFHAYNIYVISAFLAIYIQMKPYHTIQSHINTCALKTLEEDEVLQYVSCCLSELYTKVLGDTSKTLTKMKQTYKKVLNERPVFASLLKAKRFQRDHEALVPASSWDTFRPPKKITTTSVPVAAYFKRLFERAAEEKPLKVSVSKVPYFRNACCITSLTGDYRYEKSFTDTSAQPSLHTTHPRSVVIPSKEHDRREHLFNGKPINVPSAVVHKLSRAEVDITDIVWQLNRFMEKNPLFKKDKALTHLFENVGKEQTWYKFAGITETLFAFVQEYLGTSSKTNLEFMKPLKSVIISLEVSNEEMPAVCNAVLAFVKNDMKRIIATAVNDYDVVTRLGRTSNKYLRKNPSEVAIIESAVKARDTFSNMRFGIRQNETFQSSGVKEVLYKLMQQAAHVSSIHGIESSNHLSKTIKMLSIVNYIHLKFVLLLIWAITLDSPADFDSRHEEYEQGGDVARYIHDIRGVQATGDRESLVAVTQSLAYAIELSLHHKIENFKNVATSLKTGIEVMREAKKMKKIEINEMLDEENRGIIKQLEKLGLLTLQQTLRGAGDENEDADNNRNSNDAAPFPEMIDLGEEEPSRQDISESHNRMEEEENYIIPQHIGENEDEMNDDEYYEY
jgi:hypothetical protein